MPSENFPIDSLLEDYVQARAMTVSDFRLSDAARANVLNAVRNSKASQPTLTVDQLLEAYANSAPAVPPLSEFSRNQVLASLRRGASRQEIKASTKTGWRGWLSPFVLAPVCLALVMGILFFQSRPDPIRRRLTLAALAVRGGDSPLSPFSSAAELMVHPSLSSLELKGEGGLQLKGILAGGRLESVEGETLAVFDLRVSGDRASQESGSLTGRLVWALSETASSIEAVVRDPASRLRFSGEWVGADGRRQPVEFR